MSVSNILNTSDLIPSTLLSTSTNLTTGNIITTIAVSSAPTSKITASQPDSNGVVTLGPAFLAPCIASYEVNGTQTVTSQGTEVIMPFLTVTYATPNAFNPTTSSTNFNDITIVNKGVYKISYTLVASTAAPNSQGYVYLKIKNGAGLPLSATAFQIYQADDSGGNTSYTNVVTHTFVNNIQAGTILNFVVVNTPAVPSTLSQITLDTSSVVNSPAVILTIQLIDYF